ncbi:MAG: hypothetical protein WCQ21_33530, partial [Verrucomicrobiota bacterium]
SRADRNVRAPMPLGIHAQLANNFDDSSTRTLRRPATEMIRGLAASQPFANNVPFQFALQTTRN